MIAPVTRIQPGAVLQVGRIAAKCCACCGVTRELERFQSKPDRPGGVDDYCSSCRNPIERAYRQQKSRH